MSVILPLLLTAAFGGIFYLGCNYYHKWKTSRRFATNNNEADISWKYTDPAIQKFDVENQLFPFAQNTFDKNENFLKEKNINSQRVEYFIMRKTINNEAFETYSDLKSIEESALRTDVDKRATDGLNELNLIEGDRAIHGVTTQPIEDSQKKNLEETDDLIDAESRY